LSGFVLDGCLKAVLNPTNREQDAYLESIQKVKKWDQSAARNPKFKTK